MSSERGCCCWGFSVAVIYFRITVHYFLLVGQRTLLSCLQAMCFWADWRAQSAKCYLRGVFFITFERKYWINCSNYAIYFLNAPSFSFLFFSSATDVTTGGFPSPSQTPSRRKQDWIKPSVLTGQRFRPMQRKCQQWQLVLPSVTGLCNLCLNYSN